MNKFLRSLTVGLFAVFFASAAQAADLAPGAYSAGSVRGNASFKVPGSDQFQRLTPGIALPQGAIVKTESGATVTIVFGSGSIASIQENSEIEITKFEQALFSGPIPVASEPAVSNTEIRIINGGVTSKVAKLMKGSSYTINTPVGAAGVRGTTFNVFFNAETGSFIIATVEGLVEFTSNQGITTPVAGGQQFLGLLDIDAETGAATLRGSSVMALPEEVRAAIEAAVGVIAGNTDSSGTAAGLTIVPVETTQIGVSPN
jgi:hypothetical protein